MKQTALDAYRSSLQSPPAWGRGLKPASIEPAWFGLGRPLRGGVD